MRRYGAVIGLAAFVGSSGTAVEAQSFRHPGVLVNRAQLDFVKGKVQSGAQPWKGAEGKAVPGWEPAGKYQEVSYVVAFASTALGHGRVGLVSRRLVAVHRIGHAARPPAIYGRGGEHTNAPVGRRLNATGIPGRCSTPGSMRGRTDVTVNGGTW
jgi:hypothetical protein